MNTTSKEPTRYGRKARLKIAVNVVVVSALAALFVLFVNIGANRWAQSRQVRLDLTAAGTFTLEDDTLDFVRQIDRDVEIYLVLDDTDPMIRSAARADISATRADSGLVSRLYRPMLLSMGHRVASLVNEAVESNDKIAFNIADSARDLERPRRWRNDLGLDAMQMTNHLIFRAPKTNAIKTYSLFRIFDVSLGGPHPTLGHRAPEIRGDWIEPFLVAGLRAVMTPEKKKVLFSFGHEEERLPAFERALVADAFEVGRVDLGTVDAVPEDCDLLVVATPSRAWRPSAIEAIARHLERGKSLMLLLGRSVREDFESLLDEYGISMRSVQVGHPRDHAVGQGPFVLQGTPFMRPPDGVLHPITGFAVEERLPILLGFARGLTLDDHVDVELVRRRVLLHSGDEATLMPFLVEDTGARQAPERGVGEGDVPLAVTIEVSHSSSSAASEGARVLVFGSDEWLLPSALEGGFNLANREIALGAASWLMKRERVISSTPRRLLAQRAPLDSDQFTTFKSLTVWMLPAFIVLVGFFVFLMRRRS